GISRLTPSPTVAATFHALPVPDPVVCLYIKAVILKLDVTSPLALALAAALIINCVPFTDTIENCGPPAADYLERVQFNHSGFNTI
nr:hypothetical protein [Planctomycetota bacterium]